MKHEKKKRILPLILLIGFPVLLLAGVLFYVLDGNWAVAILLAVFSLLSLGLALATARGFGRKVRLAGRMALSPVQGCWGWWRWRRCF